jgi:hypothetical protein
MLIKFEPATETRWLVEKKPVSLESFAGRLRTLLEQTLLTGPTLFSKVSSSCGCTMYHQRLPLSLPTAVQNADIRHHTDVAINAPGIRNRRGNAVRSPLAALGDHLAVTPL